MFAVTAHNCVLIKQLLAISFWPLALSLDCKPFGCSPSLARETHKSQITKIGCPVIYPITKLPIYQISYLCALCVRCGGFFFAFVFPGFIAGFAETAINFPPLTPFLCVSEIFGFSAAGLSG